MNLEQTVFVVDDDAAVRESVQFLVESANLRAVTFASPQEFLDAYHPDQPGCLILDVRLPGMTGLELQKHLRLRGVRLPVIIVTGYGDVPNAVQAMRDGADDFIEKPYDDRLLLERVRQALERDQYERQTNATTLQVRRRMESLTSRETEVMDQVVEGRPNKQIAQALGISTKTVEAHRARVMEKMYADSLAALVRMVQSATPRDSNRCGNTAPQPVPA